MTDRQELDLAIRRAASESASETGMAAEPSDFQVDYQLEGSVPGAELFVASCPKEPVGSFTVTGLAVYDGPVLIGPQVALSKAFELWGAAGSPPDAVQVAKVATALYGAGHRTIAALDEGSLETVRDGVPGDGSDLVRLPRMIEADGRPGVELWWRSGTAVSRVRFQVDSRGLVATDQATAADVAKE